MDENLPQKAVIAAVQLPGVDDDAHRAAIAELKRLLETLGHPVVGVVTQRRSSLSPGGVLGDGKLKVLAQHTGGTGVVPRGPRDKKKKDDDADDGPPLEPVGDVPHADLVVVNHEISPSQARNLERACGCDVLDRPGVIIQIFHRHARSREARLQVEIARLEYEVPRMREGAGGGDRQRGGVGGRGAGESSLELDRRKVRDRIAELKEQLEQIAHEQSVRRARRAEQARVALVGYTNAGKSSWMRALTGTDVLVADKLFATLDTTVRALLPETVPRVLVSDTVGFISNLPHSLVASFRSTLDEALEASVIYHVVDAADPTFRTHMGVTNAVLAEIGAGEIPMQLVLNKADCLSPGARRMLRDEFPDALLVSAFEADDVTKVREAILAFFQREHREVELFVPYAKGGLVGEIRARAKVVSETYEGEGTRFVVRASPAVVGKLEALIAGR